MLPILRVGPLAIQTPGLVLIAGYWLALELAGRQGKRQGLDGGALQNAGVYGVVAGLLAARLGHVLQHWPVYRSNLLGVLSLNPQTLAPEVGLVAGCLVGIAYLQRKGLPLRPVLDAIAPAIAVLVCASALANLCSGAAFGIETQVPWALELWGARRQPVQLYELAAGLLTLGLLLWAGRRGLRFPLLMALFGATRLALEPLRASSHLLPGGLRTAQVAGLILMLVALALMRAWARVEPDLPEPAPEAEDRASAGQPPAPPAKA